MVYFKRTAFALLAACLIVAVGIGIILFSRGYRPNFGDRTLGSKGILVANSAPQSAQIYVNNKFMGLTSNNLYLSPGFYDVVIKKEGYSAWKKHFAIKGEVVSRVDAQMFSSNPSLSPLTNNGVINPVLSPERDNISYLVLPDNNELALEENDGLMITSLTSGTLNFFKAQNQLIPYSQLPQNMIPEKTKMIFSNDEKNILILFYGEDDLLTSAILTSLSGSNKEYLDVTVSYQQFLDKWWTEKNKIQEKQYDTAKNKIRPVLKKNTFLIEVSPDKSKYLYFVLKDGRLPRVIEPPLIGSVPTKEARYLKAGQLYVYDKKEDKNFEITALDHTERKETLEFLNLIKAEPMLSETQWLKLNSLFNHLVWYSDSRHIVYSQNETVSIIEYDGANKISVYSGPYEPSFLAATSDGKLVTLTNINPKKNTLPDLYTVSIK